MTAKLAISADELKIIKKILLQHLPSHAKVWVFGSRAKNTKKKSADLDLAIDNGKPLTLNILANLKEDFTESVLPYKVDIVDWHSISDSFKTAIENELIVLI